MDAVKAGKRAYGYNAATGEYGDMVGEGILDPGGRRLDTCQPSSP
ncbi:MAG: hypothetical protein ABI769_17385 [Pseudomonadota bacterium]